MLSYEKNLREFGRQFSPETFSFSDVGKLRTARPDGIVICGMGGSGLPGLILEKLAGELKIPVPVVSVRDETLPKTGFRRPLFILISFSGETAETINDLKSALHTGKKAGVAIIAGGGKLETLAEKNRLPRAIFSVDDLTPRESLGTMFYGLIEILRTVFNLRGNPSFKPTNSLRLEVLGKKLAKVARGRNVLVFTDPDFSHLGYIWKTNLNETAKIPAFANVYPELFHNEISEFEKKSGSWIILWLKNKRVSPENRKMRITEKILGERNVKSVEVQLQGKTRWEKTWNGVVLSHWMSLALARVEKIDPRRTRTIDELKRRFK
jgi:glucose/mannose-6-phosphate isomerase